MPPAPNDPIPHIVPIAHTPHFFEAAAREHTTSLVATKDTTTLTTTITSTIFETEHSETTDAGGFHTAATIPHIHGIITGAPRALRVDLQSHSLSLSNPPPQVTTSAAAPPSTPTRTSHKSNYPRPSPPGFFFPFAIVPPAAYLAQQQQQQNPLQHARAAGTPYHPASVTMKNYELSYLPPGLKVLFLGILAVLTLALAWTLLVWCINFPPGTWSLWTNEGNSGRRKKSANGVERRPLDKPSKYAGRDIALDRSMCATSQRATTSALNMRSPLSSYNATVPWDNTYGSDAIELIYRPRQRFILDRPSPIQQDEQLTNRSQNTYINHRRTTSSPSAGSPFSIGSSPSTTNATATPSTAAPTAAAAAKLEGNIHSPPRSTSSSPPNPFLKPPNSHFSPFAHAHASSASNKLKPRNSSEWLEERAAFFANNNNSNRNQNNIPNASPTPFLHTSASYLASSYECLDTAAMEAMEAGTAPLTGHAARSKLPSGEEELGAQGEGWLRRGLGWVDQGLGVMDGAVDKVVARWTDGDEDDDDDGLILPVAGC